MHIQRNNFNNYLTHVTQKEFKKDCNFRLKKSRG